MRSIQQHGCAGVDGEAEEGQSGLTSVLARHQGKRLWCCWHNLPLQKGEKVTQTGSGTRKKTLEICKEQISNEKPHSNGPAHEHQFEYALLHMSI